MQLYYMPGSCALSCHISLEWSGTPYEATRVSLEDTKSETFLSINPKGKVPALRIGDDVLTEAAAILVHIGEENPEAALLPPPGLPRGRLLETLSELTGEFHPSFAPLFVPERFAAGDVCHDHVREAARRRVAAHYDRWNDRMQGRAHILDAGRSVADAYLYVMCRWSDRIDRAISEWPDLAAFSHSMEQNASVRAALSQEGLSPIND